MSLPELLVRLLIGVLIYWIGERLIALIGDSKLQQILSIILIIAIVLYVVFGSVFPIR